MAYDAGNPELLPQFLECGDGTINPHHQMPAKRLKLLVQITDALGHKGPVTARHIRLLPIRGLNDIKRYDRITRLCCKRQSSMVLHPQVPLEPHHRWTF